MENPKESSEMESTQESHEAGFSDAQLRSIDSFAYGIVSEIASDDNFREQQNIIARNRSDLLYRALKGIPGYENLDKDAVHAELKKRVIERLTNKIDSAFDEVSRWT